MNSTKNTKPILSEEEKEKIIEEEKLRAEIRQQSSHTNGIISLLLGLVSFLFGMFGIVLAIIGMYFGDKSRKLEKGPLSWIGIAINGIYIIWFGYTFGPLLRLMLLG